MPTFQRSLAIWASDIAKVYDYPIWNASVHPTSPKCMAVASVMHYFDRSLAICVSDIAKVYDCRISDA
jgi:acetolactate synthase regulatory subunit